MSINRTIFDALTHFVQAHPLVGSWIPFLTDTLPALLVVALVVFLLVHNHEDEDKGMHSVVTLFAAAGAGFAFTGFLKSFFSVARPFASLDITPLISVADAYGSFPSGHALFFATIATVMWFYHRGVSVLIFCATLVIGLARIAAGVHWPADIAGGIIVGILAGLIVHHGYYALLGMIRK